MTCLCPLTARTAGPTVHQPPSRFYAATTTTGDCSPQRCIAGRHAYAIGRPSRGRCAIARALQRPTPAGSGH